MPQPAARTRRLAEIKVHDAAKNWSLSGTTATLAEGERHWLLGEVDRLTRERDRAREKYKRLRRVIRDWLIPLEPE